MPPTSYAKIRMIYKENSMKIKTFSVNVNGDYEFSPDKPICVLSGQDAELHLRLLGMMIGCADSTALVETTDSPLFILHGDVEMYNKDYGVCFIYSKTEPHRVAVNFAKGGRGFSVKDTEQYQRHLRRNGSNSKNILSFPGGQNDGLSESEYARQQLEQFITRAAESTSRGDRRPLFIYGLFDRLDAAVDVRPYLVRLGSLGRQVFISVNGTYPMEKLARPFVQIIETNE